MIKYIPAMTSVVVEEIPDMLTLAVEITNCLGHCPGCHSPFLRQDIGEELNEAIVDKLLADNYGINCFLFLGEGNDEEALLRMADYIHSAHGIKVALYSGREDVENKVWEAFDYIKTGPYIEELGPLNSINTNQRLYKVEHKGYGDYERTDITFRFRHKGLAPHKNKAE